MDRDEIKSTAHSERSCEIDCGIIQSHIQREAGNTKVRSCFLMSLLILSLSCNPALWSDCARTVFEHAMFLFVGMIIIVHQHPILVPMKYSILVDRITVNAPTSRWVILIALLLPQRKSRKEIMSDHVGSAFENTPTSRKRGLPRFDDGRVLCIEKSSMPKTAHPIFFLSFILVIFECLAARSA